MRRKFLIVFIIVAMALNFAGDISIANEKGKVILITLNRTSLNDLTEISSIKEEVDKRGYIGLMNIKASLGTSDVRSYGTIGAGTRAYLNIEDLDFQTINEENKNIYLRRTNIKPKLINNLNVNKLAADNLTGEFGAYPGALGYEFRKNNLSIAMLGNADTDLEIHREACLIAMDENGQIQKGDIENLNIKDELAPFGIRTDYNKLLDETRKYYNNSDLVVVELGDTYRLDLYKDKLNESSYASMKKTINKNISSYLDEVFKIAKKEDRIYIVSPYPNLLDYQNGYRLAPIMLFEGDQKGLLASGTTKRAGVVANIDISSDILDYFNIKSELIVGKSFNKNVVDNPIEYLSKDYEKIVSTANIRYPVLYTYAVFEMIIWILAMLAIMYRKNVSKKIFNILSFILKFTMTIPLVFLIAPILNLNSEISIIASLIIILGLLYYLIHKFAKEDLKILITLSILTSIAILIDVATGQNLMKNSVLGYDVIVGARYYGVGNEYEGVILGVVAFGLSGLLHYKKISKGLVCALMLTALFIQIYPGMGANVGGIFSGGFCFLYFILNMYNVKIDAKKFTLICMAVGLGVVSMALIDIFALGGKSHLSGFIYKIGADGPIAILQMIQRKIAMNIKLISVSIWSRVLILAVIIVSVLLYKPFGTLKKLYDIYPMLSKAWTAIIVGSIVGFLANDSGVIVAATGISYVIIPVLVLTIKNIDKLSNQS